MPLFTVTMRAGRSADETERLSRAIHAASVAAGYPANDLFQRLLSLEPSHFRVDPRYPALPKPRTGQMLIMSLRSWCHQVPRPSENERLSKAL